MVDIMQQFLDGLPSMLIFGAEKFDAPLIPGS